MKKLFLFFPIASLLIMLAGCSCINHEMMPATCTEPATCSKCGYTEGEALGHDWTPATCTVPKTCKVCEATEGEPKEHNLTKATFQTQPTCKDCGALVGEVLTPGFVEHSIKIDSEKTDEEVEFVAKCYTDSTKTTVGKMSIKDFKLVEDEKEIESLEQKRGYAWASFDLSLVFDDKNAYDYGALWEVLENDFYDIDSFDDSVELDEDGNESFTVNYLGKNWDQCMIMNDPFNKNISEWQDDKYVVDYIYYIRLPKEYDGYVLSVVDGSIELKEDTHIYDIDCKDEQIATIKLPALK